MSRYGTTEFTTWPGRRAADFTALPKLLTAPQELRPRQREASSAHSAQRCIHRCGVVDLPTIRLHSNTQHPPLTTLIYGKLTIGG